MTHIEMFHLALGIYLISTIFYLFFLTFRAKWTGRAGHYLLLLAFFLHLASIALRFIMSGYTPITNIHEALSFFALTIAGFFLFIKRTYPVEILGSLILPIISVILIWASLLPNEIRPLPPVLQSYWLPIHTVFCFLGNAAFVVAFFVSVVYVLTERTIKKKRFSIILERFPSLETLDAMNYRCMSYGFPFLTVGIITGSLWAGLAWGAYWSWDPKETFSLITWIVYAILLHNRLTIGWRGRKTAYMLILGFVFILVTLFGVNFFIGGMHSYL
jgi:cytochrome c-type biogenesis protein CcsB